MSDSLVTTGWSIADNWGCQFSKGSMLTFGTAFMGHPPGTTFIVSSVLVDKQGKCGLELVPANGNAEPHLQNVGGLIAKDRNYFIPFCVSIVCQIGIILWLAFLWSTKFWYQR